MAKADNTLPWLSNYDAALAQARASHKRLLINFTGYTCTNCRYNEARVFPAPAVQAALADYVRVELYTDGGADGPRSQALQQAKFGDVALPLYGVIDPETETARARTAGLQSPDSFARFLRASSQPPAMVNASEPWRPYSPESIAQAARSGQPVIIDFTAKWCVNCKVIERQVFDSKSIAPRLAPFVTLKADMTQWDSPASLALQKQYKFAALPTVLFLDKTGHEIKSLRITGLLTVPDFARRLTAAQGQ